MNRMTVCTVIISLVFCLCVCVSLFIRHKSKEMIRELDETVTLLENHEKDKAFDTIDHIMDDWQKIEFLTDNLVNNRYNIELNIAMSRLKPYIETDNDEIFAEISACQQLLKRTYEGELRL